jgi:hypothetical protein
MFCRSLFVPLFLFLLAIVLSVLLRFTDSDYLPLVSSNSSWYHQSFLKYQFYSLWFGRISGVMIMVFASSAVDRGFESRSNQTNEYNIIICCSFHRHVTLRNKSKYYLAQDQHNVSTWSDMSTMAQDQHNVSTWSDMSTM